MFLPRWAEENVFLNLWSDWFNIMMWTRPGSWKSQTTSNFQSDCIFEVSPILLSTLYNPSLFLIFASQISVFTHWIYVQAPQRNFQDPLAKQESEWNAQSFICLEYEATFLFLLWIIGSTFLWMRINEKIYTRSILNTLQCYWAFGLQPEADVGIRMLAPTGFVYESLPVDLNTCSFWHTNW